VSPFSAGSHSDCATVDEKRRIIGSSRIAIRWVWGGDGGGSWISLLSLDEPLRGSAESERSFTAAVCRLFSLRQSCGYGFGSVLTISGREGVRRLIGG
jgi:hypothetical protein